MKRRLIGFILLAVLMNWISCAGKEIVKLDLTDFNENPEAYRGKRVILKTDIGTLLKDPSPYQTKDVEISGFVKENPIVFEWGFYLENEAGLRVKCYERKYRQSPWIRADMAVRRARRENETMTVVGVFRNHFGIELDWIEYGGDFIDTDFKPDVISFPFWR